MFGAHILALVASKFILAWKMRRMVDNRARRNQHVGLPREVRRMVEAAEQRAEDVILENINVEERDRTGMTPIERVRRGFRVWTFTRRLSLATRERESVDEITVEVAEAVAQHWKDVRWFYVKVVMHQLTIIFLFVTVIIGVAASSA